MSFRIASWNINSVRARIGIVERLLREQAPDVLCLQETKCEDALFPHASFAAMGYPHVYPAGQRMHHGVAIVSKVALTPNNRFDWQDNGEARHVGVRLPNGVLLENVYVPAGGDIPDRTVNPKFGQKLDFLGRMTRWSEGLREPSIVLGDFNIAPLPEDVWDHKALLDVVSHTPVEVETLAALQSSHGWADLGRLFVPPPARLYTWWSYRAADWAASNRGRRLDHVWCSPEVRGSARAVTTLVAARGWEKPSDHVPLIADFDF
ncbi:exodeoxyribonuclease III [Sandaracinobacteroides saxicola]|uniref:Exodeoxyribonuclease III n=1 Tax=Sandaracinobacteroides saxicola TaxID=2759707 RepID=A0A7G5IE67_9SPHN|nr:exodeoxyribonuclease III [Sandaracinobacteroides saxicola]QMW21659.1 exodeoxyribonuclease III [Sandaracinobacteroides saxicola]